MRGTKAILLVGALALAAGAAEILLRLAPSDPDPVFYRKHDGDPVMEPDSLLGFRSSRGVRYRVWSRQYDIQVQTNSLGLRGPDLEETLAGWDCRVLLVGDSFVQGLTVPWDESFGQVAARSLQARTGRKCAFVAGGVESYSTDQELLFFRRDLVTYRPTLTVLFVYWNDIVCNAVPTACGGSRPWVFRIENDSLIQARAAEFEATPRTPQPRTNEGADAQAQGDQEPGSRLPFRNIRGWLVEHSRLFALVRRSARIALGLDRPPPERGMRSAFFHRPFPVGLTVFRRDYDSTVVNAWDLTERLILQLEQEANAIGSQFALFYVPMRESVHADQWEFVSRLNSLAEYDPARVEKHLARFCEENEIRCFDPSSLFRQHVEDGGGSFYLLEDPHWNADGHAFVGRLLADSVASIIN